MRPSTTNLLHAPGMSWQHYLDLATLAAEHRTILQGLRCHIGHIAAMARI